MVSRCHTEMEIKACTKCGERKELDAFYVQARGRYGRTAQCRECHKQRMRVPEDKRVRRRGRAPGYEQAYRKAHAEERRAYFANWRRTHPDAAGTARMARWRENNPEKARAANAAWSKAHPAAIAAKTRRRKAQKLSATPAWANEFFISEAYELAQIRTQLTGFAWHVDHIVPLRSKRVCGLHVEHNLQVIPGAANSAKGNRHWPDMPETRVDA